MKLSGDHVLSKHELSRRGVEDTVIASAYGERSIVYNFCPVGLFVTANLIHNLEVYSLANGVCLRGLRSSWLCLDTVAT